MREPTTLIKELEKRVRAFEARIEIMEDLITHTNKLRRIKEVPRITTVLNQQQLEDILMDLLCLDNKETWITRTKSYEIALKFVGDFHKTQKRVYDWLSVPDRKHNFILMTYKEYPCESESKDEI